MPAAPTSSRPRSLSFTRNKEVIFARNQVQWVLTGRYTYNISSLPCQQRFYLSKGILLLSRFSSCFLSISHSRFSNFQENRPYAAYTIPVLPALEYDLVDGHRDQMVGNLQLPAQPGVRSGAGGPGRGAPSGASRRQESVSRKRDHQAGGDEGAAPPVGEAVPSDLPDRQSRERDS